MTTTPTPSQEPLLPREAYTLLAQANLLRMRGRWEEAVENCMAALRLAPENASAQSLLGDIYENQGRLDDAVQWYRMALDINPDSPADRMKLGRLLETQQRRLAAVPAPGHEPAALQGGPPPRVGQRNRPETFLRWGAWLVGLLAVLVIVLAGVAMAKTHRTTETQVTAPPVTLAAPAATAPGQPDAPAAGDASEQALLQALQQDASLTGAKVTAVAVQADPRLNGITLTLLCPPPSAGTDFRENLLRDSLLAAQAGVRSQGDHVTAWTVRCLLPPTPGSPPALAFVADISTAAVSSLGSAASGPPPAAQMLSSFHNPWWSPAATQ